MEAMKDEGKPVWGRNFPIRFDKEHEGRSVSMITGKLALENFTGNPACFKSTLKGKSENLWEEGK